jgi:hypothetical protein
MPASTHMVIDGNQVKSSHPDFDSAQAAAVLEAKAKRTVQIVQILSTVAPQTGVTITKADGTTETINS